MIVADISRLWVLEAAAYELCYAFTTLNNSNAKSCRCIHRLVSLWRNLVGLLPEDQLYMLENWVVVCWIICFSYDYKCKDALVRLLLKVDNQLRKLDIDSDISSSVKGFLHTMITLHYYESGNIRKALKYVEDNEVLYNELVKNLLKSDGKSLFPEELKVHSLQKYLVPYVEAVMKYLGTPKIHKVISNFQTPEDETFKESSNILSSSQEIFHEGKSCEYDMVIRKEKNSDVRPCLPEVTSCLLDSCKSNAADNAVSSSSDFQVNCLSGGSYKQKDIDFNVADNSLNIDAAVGFRDYIPPKSRNKNKINILSSGTAVVTDYPADSSGSNLTKSSTCKGRNSEIQYRCNKKYIKRSKYQDTSSLKTKNVITVSNEDKNAISNSESVGINLTHGEFTENTQIDATECKTEQCERNFNSGKINSSNGDSKICENLSTSNVSTIFHKTSARNSSKTRFQNVSLPLKRSATKIASSYSGESVAWTSDEDFESFEASRKQLKKSRVKFSEKEEEYIIDGVKMYGQGEWRKILDAYPFHKSRTNVSIKDKYRTMVRTGSIK